MLHFASPSVDFPSSPTALRSMVHPSDDSLGMGVRLAEREEPPQAPATPTEEDRSMYTAVVSPPTGQVTLRKGRRLSSALPCSKVKLILECIEIVMLSKTSSALEPYSTIEHSSTTHE